MQPRPAPRYGSAAELARSAGLSPKTVRRLVDAGKVRGLKVGRRLLIPYADLDNLILMGHAGRARNREEPVMATTHRTEAEAALAPYVPPLDPAELARRNRAAAALLDAWEAEGDEQEQRATFAVLREALGERRVMSSRPALL